MGLADLHIHTTYSFDGTSSVTAVLQYAAHHTSLDVIAITDHDKIDGALKALDLAPSYGIEVIPGSEVTSTEGHVLALFVHEPIPAGLSLERTVLETVERGGLCIVPHPMMNSRIGVNFHAISRALHSPEVAAGLVGVEIHNAGLLRSQQDLYTKCLIRQLPLATVGCSDAHVDWMIGLAATQFYGHSALDLRQALINHQVRAQLTSNIKPRDFLARYIPRLALRYVGWNARNQASSDAQSRPGLDRA